jgi:hypothetical protein
MPCFYFIVWNGLLSLNNITGHRRDTFLQNAAGKMYVTFLHFKKLLNLELWIFHDLSSI